MEESLELARQAGDNNEIAYALQSLGHLALARGDYDQAQAQFEQARAQSSEIDLFGGGWDNLGHVALKKGDTRQATSWYKQTLALYWELGEPIHIAFALEDLAHVAVVCRQLGRAARLLGAAEVLRESSDYPMLPSRRLELEYDSPRRVSVPSLMKRPGRPAWPQAGPCFSKMPSPMPLAIGMSD